MAIEDDFNFDAIPAAGGVQPAVGGDDFDFSGIPDVEPVAPVVPPGISVPAATPTPQPVAAPAPQLRTAAPTAYQPFQPEDAGELGLGKPMAPEGPTVIPWLGRKAVEPAAPATPPPEYVGELGLGQPIAPDDAPDGGDSYLTASGKAGGWNLLGGLAKVLDTVNPWTLSESDAAVLYKNDPAKLKEMQDSSVTMVLSRFAHSMQGRSEKAMENLTPEDKPLSKLEYLTADQEKAAYRSPTRVIGDAIQSLPTSLAMGITAYLTRGAASKAEAMALANGATASAARAEAIKAGTAMAARMGAGSEGAFGYAQQAEQTHSQLSKLSPEDMAKAPLYQQLMEEGYSPQAARAAVIARTSEEAGVSAGAVDAIVNKVGGEFLGKILTEGGRFIPRVLKGAATEGITETVQSGGEQLGQNAATQKNVNPDQSLTEGVGESMAQGLVVGNVMGGVTAGFGGKGNDGVKYDKEAIEDAWAKAEALHTARLRMDTPQPGGSAANADIDGMTLEELRAKEPAPAAPEAPTEPSGEWKTDVTINGKTTTTQSAPPSDTPDLDALLAEEEAAAPVGEKGPDELTPNSSQRPPLTPEQRANVNAGNEAILARLDATINDEQSIGRYDAEGQAHLRQQAESLRKAISDYKAEKIITPADDDITPPPKPGELDQVPWTAKDGNPWGMSDEDYAVWRTLPENAEAVARWNKDNNIIDDEAPPARDRFGNTMADLEDDVSDRDDDIQGERDFAEAPLEGEVLPPGDDFNFNNIPKLPTEGQKKAGVAAQPGAEAQPVETLPGADGMEARIYKSTDGKSFNVVMHDTESGQNLPVVTKASSIGYARALAKRALTGEQPTQAQVDEHKQVAKASEGKPYYHLLRRNPETGNWEGFFGSHNEQDIDTEYAGERQRNPNAEFMTAETRTGSNDTAADATRQLKQVIDNIHAGEDAQQKRPSGGKSIAGPRVMVNYIGKDGLTDAERKAGKAPLNDEAKPLTEAQAYDAGVDAFQAGALAAPRNDPKMKGQPIDAVKAWVKGWHAANTAKGVPGVTEDKPTPANPFAAFFNNRDELVDYLESNLPDGYKVARYGEGSPIEVYDPNGNKVSTLEFEAIPERDRVATLVKRIKADAEKSPAKPVKAGPDYAKRAQDFYAALRGTLKDNHPGPVYGAEIDSMMARVSENIGNLNVNLPEASAAWAMVGGSGELTHAAIREYLGLGEAKEPVKLTPPDRRALSAYASAKGTKGPDADVIAKVLKRGTIETAGEQHLFDMAKEAAEKKAAPKAAKKPAPAAKPAKEWKEIGKNADGETLFEDERGVRSKVEGNIRISEAVGIKPGSKEINTDRIGKKEWQTAKEWAEANPADTEAPEWFTARTQAGIDALAGSSGLTPTQRAKVAKMSWAAMPDDARGRLSAAAKHEDRAKEMAEWPQHFKDTAATAPAGVTDGELSKIVEEFNNAQSEMMEGEHPVSNIFQPPAKKDIVRLADKARIYTKENGWMTPAEAKAQIAKWKAHAKAQGKTSANSDKVVLSLFDLSGEWSKPWEEAGYQVYRFDIQDDPEVGDVNNFSTEFFGDWFVDFDGMDIHAILAANPCTDFAVSGARHFAAKDKDGRTVASVKLVHQTLRTIEYFKPAVWAIENPVGRIEDLGGLPPWRLSFDPNHIGDPYTKKTLLWGRFNGDLPVAPVEPTEGSKMWSQYGGKSQATKNARSVTPEGFSYGFFMANNAVDHPAMAVANKYDRLDRGLIEKAIAAGVTPEQIDNAVEDFYYQDLDDAAANEAIRDLRPETKATASDEDADFDAEFDAAFDAAIGKKPVEQAEKPNAKPADDYVKRATAILQSDPVLAKGFNEKEREGNRSIAVAMSQGDYGKAAEDAAYSAGRQAFLKAVAEKAPLNSIPDLMIDAAEAAFEEEWKTSQSAPKAAPRTTKQVAKSAVKNAAGSADDAMSALVQMFGGGKQLGMGVAFTPENYAKAKPLLMQSASKFGAFKNDVTELVQRMVEEMRRVFGLSDAGLEDMRPFLRQFVKDVRSGDIVIPEDDAISEQEKDDGNAEPDQSPDQGSEPDADGNRGGRDGERGGGSSPDADGGGDVSGPRGGGNRPGGVSKTGSGGRRLGGLGSGGKRGTGKGVSSKSPGSKGRGRGGRPDVVDEVSDAEAPNLPAANFRITPDVQLGKGTELTKFNDNLDAIRIIKAIEAENRRATPGEQRKLARYVGWGGLANAFADPDGNFKDGWEKRGKELAELLTPAELKAARASTRNAHYTSETVVRAMWDAAEQLGFRGGLALELSAGTGNFLGMVPESIAGQTRFIAVEYDSITSRITKALYQQDTVLNAGMQNVPLPDGEAVLNIGNPPFGSESLRFQYKPEINGKSIHNQFFLAGLDALRPGGLQILVVSRFLMDAKDTSSRDALDEKATLLGAIRLPDTAFKENARTEVVTDILFLQRRTAAEEAAIKDIKIKAASDKNSPKYTPPAWVGTTEIPDPDGGDAITVNSYFARNRNMIMGTLNRSGSMRVQNDVTVSLPKDANLGGMLQDAIKRLPSNVLDLNQEVIDRSVERQKTMGESLEIAISGVEPGHISINADGKMEHIYERETPNKDYELVRRVLTPTSPWSARLNVGPDNNWYTLEPRLDAKGEKVKQGARLVYDPKLFPDNKVPGNLQIGKPKFDRLRKLVELRDLVKRQLVLESTDAATDKMESNRRELAKAYKAFVAEHGFINIAANASLLGGMPDGALVLALEFKYRAGMSEAKAKRLGEKPVPPSADPAPIMERRVVPKWEPATKADTPQDAIAMSLSELGRVDMPRIAGLLGVTEEQAAEVLQSGDTPLIFRDPETMTWETRDNYLSGQVARKLKAAKAADLPGNVKALEAIQPARWEADSVQAMIGSVWVPGDIYANFITHLGGGEGNTVRHSPLTNTFDVQTGHLDSGKIAAWQTDDMPFHRIYQGMLNSRVPKVTYRDADGTTRVDQEASALVQVKAKEIENEYADWIFADGKRRGTLVDIFNEKFNTRVQRQHDGTHLKLPGKVPDAIIKMRRHQLNAIWRGIYERFMLLDHVVGAGKTFTAIARAMERRRMGLSRKPMIVVPNHLVGAWTADVYKLYPGAKVLAADPKKFDRKNRRRLFAQIATGDWDIVIVPHSSFKYIGVSKDTELRFLEQELVLAQEAVTAAQEQAVADGIAGGRRKPFNVKEAERLVETITGRMATLRAKNRDNLLTFEQMGVDDLTVDEAHEFKNLFYSSRLTGVRGMGDKAGSQKAFDLYNKVRVLRESPTGSVTFLTGTPISNSAVEMYNMMRYLAADELKELGIEHFDAWRNQSVTSSSRYEPTESGGLKEVSRLGRSWSNMRAQMELYYKFTDAVSQEDIDRWYMEDNNGAKFPIPGVVGGGRKEVVVKPSPAQQAILQQVIAGFNGLPQIKDPYERNAERLRLMDRARKVSLDARAVDEFIDTEETGGKLDTAADEITRIYKKWDKDLGTQLVFLDRSVPKSKGDAKVLKDYDALIAKRDKARADGDEEGYRKAIDKLDEFDQNEIDELRRAANGGWNAYAQLKENLIRRGIPANEIRFVQEANSADEKKALFDAVNDGTIRVLIGSTPRMGAGTNVQERIVGLHHMDVTWKPSDIEQREGRIIRQGNSLYDKYGEGFEVEIKAYVTERTVDAKMWDLNSTKLKMINGIRKYDNSFTMEFEDEDAVGMAEIAALASGDPLLLERVKLMSEIDKMELLERAHRRKQFGLDDRIDGLNRIIREYPGLIAQEKKLADEMRRPVAAVREAAGKRRVTVEGKEYSNGIEAMRAFEAAAEAQKAGDEKAKYSVNVNGERYSAKDKAEEAIYEALGDSNPFEATVNGVTTYRRAVLAREVHAKIAELQAGMHFNDPTRSAIVGRMFGYDLSLEVSLSNYGLTTDLALVDGDRTITADESNYPPAKPVSLPGARATVDRLTDKAAMIAQWDQAWRQDLIDKAKADLPLIEAEKGKQFRQAEDLASARTRLAEVTAVLAERTRQDEGGVAGSVPTDQELTSIFDAAPFEPTLTPQAEEKRAQLERVLTRLVRQVAGPSANVRFVATHPVKGGVGYGELGETFTSAAGSYLQAERLITVALADPKFTNPISTAFHEAFHAVEDLLLTDSELNILKDNMAGLRELVAARWKHLTREQIDQFADYEIRAMAFQAYAYNRVQKVPMKGVSGAVRRVMEKLRNVLDGVRRVLNGEGFKTPSDVFSDVYEGKAAKRRPKARGFGTEVTGALRSVNREPVEPLSEKAFYNRYSQHVDIRPGDADARAKTVMRDGFKSQGNVNTLPPYRGGQWTNVVDRDYAPRKGQTVYLVPNSATREMGNGQVIKEGWKPKPYEVIRASEDYPSMYREYLRAVDSYNKASQPLLSLVDDAPDKLPGFIRGDVAPAEIAPGETKWEKLAHVLNTKFQPAQREAMAKAVESGKLDALTPDEKKWAQAMVAAATPAAAPQVAPVVAPPAVAAPAAGGASPLQAPPAPAAAAPTPAPGPGPITYAAAKAHILSHIVPSDKHGKKMPSAQQIYTWAKDDLNPLRVLRDQLLGPRPAGEAFRQRLTWKGLRDRLAVKVDPYKLARLVRGSYGKGEQMLHYGTFAFNDLHNTGEGLLPILESVEDDQDGFRAYMVSKRVLELEARGIETGMDVRSAAAVVSHGAAKFDDAFTRLVKYQRRVLDYLRDSGVISAEGYTAMVEANKDYVPFFRLMDDDDLSNHGTSARNLKVRDPIRGIKGSDRDVIDPIESIIKNTFLYVALAEKNRALVAMDNLAATSTRADEFWRKPKRRVKPVNVTTEEMAKWLDAHGLDPADAEAFTIFRPNAFRPEPDEVAFFRDGKREIREVDPQVADAVNALDRETLGWFIKIVGLPARWLRAGATLAPEFVARNPVRDQFTAFIFSENGYVPVYDMLRGLGGWFTKDADYQEFLKGGGANASLMSIDRKYIDEQIVRLQDPSVLKRLKNVVTSPITFLRMASDVMENSTRVGGAKRGLRKGLDAFEVAWNAREMTLDFQRAGSQMRALGHIIGFFNANVEGTDREVRGFVKRPLASTVKALIAITLPSMLLWLANHDDDRYKELPDWEKFAFWHILTDSWEEADAEELARMDTGNSGYTGTMVRKADGKTYINKGTIWRIPKPFALGMLFGSVPERVLDAYYQKNPRAFKDLAGTIAGAFIPPLLPNILVPPAEQFANKSLFTDRPIVPKYLEGVLPVDQYTPFTSETAKLMGKAFSKLGLEYKSISSPLIIDNYIRAWGGGLGQYMVGLADKGLKLAGVAKDTVAPTRTMADYPVIKAFVSRNPTASAQSIQDFYDTYEERKAVMGSIKLRQRAGDAQGASELDPLEVGERVHKALGEQFKYIRGVNANPKITPDDKRRIIDSTVMQMTAFARRGVEMFDKTEADAKAKKKALERAQ